ncbi:MAG TPA: antitoxin Xre/MbcA/ParS toxin-binding domain-containing protein [Geobacteraceae bacterium]|nr:antitoxin Xre/MbcA/ParS toxin-binding domain-containing protein [Geobacteraceae bacterium]
MGRSALAKKNGHDKVERTPVEMIEQGLPYEEVEHLASELELSMEELCRIIPVSRRTLARFRGSLLDSHLSDHIYIARKVYERAAEVMESPENARLWLKTPNYTFRFKRPLEYLSSLTGSLELLDELGRLQHGVFV